MAKEFVYYSVIQKSDGHRYTIGERKYNKDPKRWEIVEPVFEAKGKVEALDGPTPEEIPAKIDEFMDTDMDLGELGESPEPEDMDYHALKDIVKAKGHDIKGNPKKEVLIELLNGE